MLGTVDYVAPELFEPDHRADARSDLYSLEVLLYEMVTGRLPFTAESQLVVVSMHMNKRPPLPRSFVPHISSQVERVINKALEKRPEQRYASATELAEAFCRAVNASNKKGRVESTGILKVEQHEVVSPVAVTDKVMLSPALPVATIDATVRSSPLANATEGYQFQGYQFQSPQHSLNTRLAKSELPQAPLPPVPTQTNPKPLKRRRWFAVVLALIALLLLTVSIVSIVIPRANGGSADVHGVSQNSTTARVQAPTNNPTATPNLTATALAAQAATATAHAQETATIIAGMTVTAEAKASATAGVIQTATSGKPVYQDGIFLIQLTDPTYSSGVIAFFATTAGTIPADVVYSNLKVYPLT